MWYSVDLNSVNSNDKEEHKETLLSLHATSEISLASLAWPSAWPFSVSSADAYIAIAPCDKDWAVKVIK